MPVIDEILSELTPRALEQVVIEIADQRAPGERAGADLGQIVDRLVAGRNLGLGAERSQAYSRLVQAIRENAALAEGLKYIKSSD
jgi:hypothetical protein